MTLQDAINVLRTTNANQTTLAYMDFDCGNDSPPTSYCAMGVLVCNKKHIKNFTDYANVDINSILREYGIDVNYRLDIEGTDYDALILGEIPCVSMFKFITTANDFYKLTFKEIADLLEATFPEGF